MKIVVIHGPNLNLLGRPEMAAYGSQTLAAVDEAVRANAKELEIDVEIHQTQREGEIIELLHSGIDSCDGAILNPAAYSHTSRAIADAIRALPYPVVEVHMSNILARDQWRRTSVTAEAARGIVAGFGSGSYVAALHALKNLVGE